MSYSEFKNCYRWFSNIYRNIPVFVDFKDTRKETEMEIWVRGLSESVFEIQKNSKNAR